MINKEIQKLKKNLISKLKRYGLKEDFGSKEVRYLRDKYGRDHWEEIQKFDEWCSNLDLDYLSKLKNESDAFIPRKMSISDEIYLKSIKPLAQSINEIITAHGRDMSSWEIIMDLNGQKIVKYLTLSPKATKLEATKRANRIFGPSKIYSITKILKSLRQNAVNESRLSLSGYPETSDWILKTKNKQQNYDKAREKLKNPDFKKIIEGREQLAQFLKNHKGNRPQLEILLPKINSAIIDLLKISFDEYMDVKFDEKAAELADLFLSKLKIEFAKNNRGRKSRRGDQ